MAGATTTGSSSPWSRCFRLASMSLRRLCRCPDDRPHHCTGAWPVARFRRRADHGRDRVGDRPGFREATMNLAVRLLLILALIAITPTVLAMMLVGGVLVAQKAREVVSRRRMMRGLDELLREDTP